MVQQSDAENVGVLSLFEMKKFSQLIWKFVICSFHLTLCDREVKKIVIVWACSKVRQRQRMHPNVR